jgi:hypothetical protein
MTYFVQMIFRVLVIKEVRSGLSISGAYMFPSGTDTSTHSTTEESHHEW